MRAEKVYHFSDLQDTSLALKHVWREPHEWGWEFGEIRAKMPTPAPNKLLISITHALESAMFEFLPVVSAGSSFSMTISSYQPNLRGN